MLICKKIFFLITYSLLGYSACCQMLISGDTVWYSFPGINLNNGEACFSIVHSQEVLRRPVAIPVPVNPFYFTGNIQYEYLYRSRLDTPFQQQDFQQHSLRLNVRTLVLNNLPVTIRLAGRISNSPYLRNSLDVNFEFDKNSFRGVNDKKLIGQLEESLLNQYQIRGLTEQYNQLQQDATYWKELGSNLSYAQLQKRFYDELTNRILEQISNQDSLADISKVKPYVQDFLRGDSLPKVTKNIARKAGADSSEISKILIGFTDKVAEMQALYHKADSLSASAGRAYQKLEHIKQLVRDSVNVLRSELQSYSNYKGLLKILNKYGIDKDSLTPSIKFLSSIQTFGIGRNLVNYSELSVHNSSIKGISVSCSPGYYIAFAAGVMDYRYRDFKFKNAGWPTQPVIAMKLGLSGSASEGFFLNLFYGKRALITTVNSNDYSKSNVYGYSLQYNYKFLKDHLLSAEYAKSNGIPYRAMSGDHQTGGLFSFSDRNNEAYSFSYQGNFRRSNTTISGNYKKIGSAFQSITPYKYDANQVSYFMNLEQLFWKKSVVLKIGIRKNEFTYPNVTNISSDLVFKTFQITLRKRGLPTLTAGYFPSSQFVMLSNQEVAQLTFQTISASSSYYFKLGNVANTSVLTFSKFKNQTTDTAFLYYNARYAGIQHLCWLGAFTIQAGYTNTLQSNSSIETLEASLSWSSPRGWSLLGGLKYSTMQWNEKFIGANASIGIPLGGLGKIQCYYELSSIPSWQARTLEPVTTGRILYTKTF